MDKNRQTFTSLCLRQSLDISCGRGDYKTPTALPVLEELLLIELGDEGVGLPL